MNSAADHSSTAPVLVVHDLVKRFGNTVAVGEMSLDVERGEIVALLGPSGCGKTTTLRLLAGFERPDSGSVLIGGETVVDSQTWRPPERRRIGIVQQDFALFPHLNVGENIAFGLTGGHRAWWTRPWRRFGKSEVPARVQEMLSLVGLDDFAHRFPHELSGGEAQRVALARALAPEPAAVLLDEPFSNLDQNLRASLRLTMRAILKAADTAAVFVTHDREEALSLADRVAVMRQGRIEQIGSPDDIYYRPQSRFIGSFVGDANILPGRRSRGGAETELGYVLLDDAPSAQEGESLDLLLRPEQLALKLADRGQTGEAGEAEAANVISSEYYGHDQVVRVRLASGREVEVRLSTDVVYRIDDAVKVVVLGDAIAFPSQ